MAVALHRKELKKVAAAVVAVPHRKGLKKVAAAAAVVAPHRKELKKVVAVAAAAVVAPQSKELKKVAAAAAVAPQRRGPAAVAVLEELAMPGQQDLREVRPGLSAKRKSAKPLVEIPKSSRP